MTLSRPSTYAGYLLTDHPFGEGFGNETANIAADFLTMPLASLGKRSFQYAWDALPKVSLARNTAGDWNGWINVGSRQYRPNMSSLGMGKLVESRIMTNPPENNVTENLLKWLGRDPNSKVIKSITEERFLTPE